MTTKRLLGVFSVLCACATAQADPAGYSVSVLAAPGAAFTTVIDVNNLGQVAGTASDGVNSRGFVYSGGSYTFLSGPAGALGSNAYGLSDNGVTVGSYYTELIHDPDTGLDYAGPAKGFVFAGGVYQSLAPVGASDTMLRGVSPDGRYVSGIFTTESSGYQGFVFDRVSSTFTAIPNAVDSLIVIAQGINAQGLVVGSDTILVPGSTSRRVAFTYDIATGIRVDQFDPSLRLSFRDINSNGNIAGWGQEVGSPPHGLVGPSTALAFFDIPGASEGTVLQGTNDAGWLSGNYTIGEQSFGFLATPVPEPQSAVLFMLGAAALLAARRRQR